MPSGGKNPMATQVVLNETQHNAIIDDVFTLTAKMMPEKAAQKRGLDNG